METGALDVLALVVTRAPGFPEGQHALGLALARSRRQREALAHLVAAVRLAPGSARYRADLEALQQRLRDDGE
jgi:Flp pilus assembly protein TadD